MTTTPYTFAIRPGSPGYVWATDTATGTQYEVYCQYASVSPHLEDAAARAALVAQARAYTPPPAAPTARRSTTTRTLAQIDAEIARLHPAARHHDAILNEGGEGYNPFTAQIHALEAERAPLAEAALEARIAARRKETDATWPLELTVARRAEWNAWVKSQDKKVSTLAVAQKIQAQGWSVDELKEAIARHGL